METVLTSNEIEVKVAQILESARVSYTVRSAGVGLNRDGWKCDGWLVSIEKEVGKPKTFDFFTGTGLRGKISKNMELTAHMSFPGLNQKDKQGLTSYGKRYKAFLESLRQPVTPHIASILHSLLSDSSAMNQSFKGWCSEFGLNTDSIKDLATYNACCENGEKLRQVIPRETWAQLEEVLQDY